MIRKPLDLLADPDIVGLWVDGGQWPRSLVSPTLVPDQWMALVQRRDGRRRFVPAGEDPAPERNERVLLVANRLVTVPIPIPDAPAADGFVVNGSVDLVVRWQGRPDDLAALGQTLLDQDDLSVSTLANAVAEAGATAALRQFIHQRPAARLVREDLREELLSELTPHLKRFLFSTAMKLERVAALALASPELEQHEALERETAQRVERIKAAELVESAALAAATHRLHDLSGLLDKLKAAAAADSRLQWHDLLPSLSPAERGRLLENLWRLTPDRRTASAIVVVGGQECLWLDPVEPQRALSRLKLDDSLGGLRSVSFCADGDALLIGAARGVWRIGARDGKVLGRHEVTIAGLPRTGFNAAVIAGQRLFATHSEFGAWLWLLDGTQPPEALFQPIDGLPRTVRAATALPDGRLLFAADNLVHVMPPDGTQDTLAPAPDVIQALAAQGDMLHAGTTDGNLFQQDLTLLDGWTPLHRSGTAIETIIPRVWNDLVELVIPAGPAGICGVYARERVVARLMESPIPIRRVWASDDLLVGLGELRDRLVVLSAALTQRTGQTASVSRMLDQLVQDACIVTAHRPPPEAGDKEA